MEVTVRHTIVLDHLDLGNNFTQSHFMDAICKHKDIDEIFDYISEIESDSEVTIMADIKFGYSTTETYIAFELCEILESHYLAMDSEIEQNTCAGCDEPIENNKTFCSEECFKNDLNS